MQRASSDLWLQRGLLVSVLLAAAVALSANAADPDLWGHVQYGRDLLRDGLPATTTYSFTAEGYRWINHENLAEILLAVGADTVGPVGLLWAKCLLSLALFGLLLWQARRRAVRPLAAGLCLLLVALNLAAHWSLRPQLVSYASYSLLLALLAWCFDGWEGRWRMRWVPWRGTGQRSALGSHPGSSDSSSLSGWNSERLKYLWLAPPLMLVWANSHGGFVAGYCIFSAYLLLRAVEALSCRGWAARGLVLRLLCMVAAAGLATLINPYGPRLHAWLFSALSIPRPEITEWHPVNWAGAEGWPLLLLVGTGVLALTLTRRSRDFTHLVLLGIILWQSVEHARHIPFLAIAFGFWLPAHVQSMLRRFRLTGRENRQSEAESSVAARRLRWGLLGAMCLVNLLLGLTLVRRLADMPVYRDQYPVAAVQFMADHQLRGRLVVTYNWAQYLIAAFGRLDSTAAEHGVSVAFDGRFRTCYPQDVVDMHFDLVLGDLGERFRYRSPLSPPFDPGRVLEHGAPNLVLLNRFQPHSEQMLRGRDTDWVLLYQDRVAQLWGRRAVYDDPALATYLAAEHRVLTELPQSGSASWPALPEPPRSVRLVSAAN
ncbi:MAG: hypothetical protein J5I93_18915 [Pirellulaceae bacterium]|nr:hypothetical protein [Pirellulaceae bacterium]